ncbi:MAG: pyrroloquinoline quinone-dependent dehydrogenase [Gammaproteobacteria bacterium]
MRALALLAIGLLAASVGHATKPGKGAPPARPDPAGWAQVGGDQGGSRYSTLDQIDHRNVWRLERAWTWRHGDLARFPGRRPYSAFQATPILLPEAAGGSLVLCTPFNRLVALDPVSGEERWSFDPQIRVTSVPRPLKCLGVTYWQDTLAPPAQHCAHRILSGTSDRRLVAVDARDGKPCVDFGTKGQLDVNPVLAHARPAPAEAGDVQFPGPPVVVNGVLVIGQVNNMKNRYASAPGGALQAFDARTGAYRWSFDPVPHGKDAGQKAGQNAGQNAGWTAESTAATGGGNPLSLLSVDEKPDLVFVSTSSVSPQWFGGSRPGDNRHANSVVALRGSTGEIVWSFQTVHHDVWNSGSPSQPLLVLVPRDGRRVPAVIVVTGQSLVFVLDRATGKPLFPVDEHPVPTDGVAGDILSATQPFPARPPPLTNTRLTPADAWGLTFWDQNRCRDLIAGARHGDVFTPPSDKGWIMFPGSAGGTNRGGGAWDPERSLLVTNLAQMGLYLKLVPRGGETRAGSIDGTPWAIEQQDLLGPTGMPCTAPPWAILVGVDLAAGEIRWSVPLGSASGPAPTLPMNWGAPIAGGPIVTAGGLAFIASTGDARLRAFDTETGTELWSTPLPTSAHAIPMTYERDGRQFVVIAAGGDMFIDGGSIDDYLVAYALPKKYLEAVR